MANRPRPRCHACTAAMEPVFAKRERGRSLKRIADMFWCRTCGVVGKGREETRYLA